MAINKPGRALHHFVIFTCVFTTSFAQPVKLNWVTAEIIVGSRTTVNKTFLSIYTLTDLSVSQQPRADEKFRNSPGGLPQRFTSPAYTVPGKNRVAGRK